MPLSKEERARIENQWAGTERKLKYRGSGWFSQDPTLFDDVRNGAFLIGKVRDYSNAKTSYDRRLPQGSFLLEIGEGNAFMISHLEDISGFLKRAGVEKSGDLKNRYVTLYWRGNYSEPVPGNSILGIDLA